MTNAQASETRGSYCPYDIVRDYEALNLISNHEPTPFGLMHTVARLDTDGPLTVFMHGIGGTWSSWTPLLQASSVDEVDLGQILLIDLPGFGSSENQLKALNTEVIGQTVLALAERLGHQRVRLIGQSMGGYLALDIAARFPDCVTHVTALAGSFETILFVGRNPLTFAGKHPRATATNVAVFAGNKLGAPGKRAVRLMRRAGARTLFDEIVAHPELLKASVSSALGGGFTARNLMYAVKNARAAGHLAPWESITAEASFVWGELDPLVPPSEASLVAEILPAAKRTVIADAAHILHIERPHDVLGALAL